MNRNVLIYQSDATTNISELIACLKRNGYDAKVAHNADELEQGLIREYSNLVFMPDMDDDSFAEIFMVCANFRAVVTRCQYIFREGGICIGRDELPLSDAALLKIFDDSFIDLSKLPKPLYST